MTAVVKGQQVANARTVRVCLLVPCRETYCRAAAGWFCTTKTGKPSSTCHASRWDDYHKRVQEIEDERR